MLLIIAVIVFVCSDIQKYKKYYFPLTTSAFLSLSALCMCVHLHVYERMNSVVANSKISMS